MNICGGKLKVTFANSLRFNYFVYTTQCCILQTVINSSSEKCVHWQGPHDAQKSQQEASSQFKAHNSLIILYTKKDTACCVNITNIQQEMLEYMKQQKYL